MPPALRVVEIAEATDVGTVRDHNEDRALVRPSLLAVADGMGGAQAGEVAAQMAVDHLGALDASDPEAVIDAIEHANRAIVAAADSDPNKSGMGTTVTALSTEGETLSIAHVGDSRAYLWRDGRLRQLTADHSVVAELVRQGKISAEEAEVHPHRNVITRALGADREVAVDSYDQVAKEGDVVLLCSDGLSGQVPDDAIASVLSHEPRLDRVATTLVNQANAAGGIDNVTVLLARLGSGPAAAMADVTQEFPTATSEKTRPSLLTPLALTVVVLAALVIGTTGWLWSRTFTVNENDGQVVVQRGLPVFTPQSVWQETGLDAAIVREAEPQALGDSALGRGEAVLLATRLVWQYGVPDAPRIQPPRPPSPGVLEDPQSPPPPPPASPGASPR